MVFINIKNKIEKVLFGDKYTVKHLVKTMLIDPTNPIEKTFLKARYNYLSTYKYNKNINQSEKLLLSDILLHDYEKMRRELPHLIYHTLEQKSRLQVIPDIGVFNLREYKCGDFISINTEQSIEAKTVLELSEYNIIDLVNQYKYNSRNDKFIFSVFYKNKQIEETLASERLLNELKIENHQVLIKSLDEVSEIFDDKNLEKAISYYNNISWLDYKLSNEIRLRGHLENALELDNLIRERKKEIQFYLKLMINTRLTKKQQKIKNLFLNKDTSLLLEDKNKLDPIDEDVLTPEDFMEDAHHWLFNEKDE